MSVIFAAAIFKIKFKKFPKLLINKFGLLVDVGVDKVDVDSAVFFFIINIIIMFITCNYFLDIKILFVLFCLFVLLIVGGWCYQANLSLKNFLVYLARTIFT